MSLTAGFTMASVFSRIDKFADDRIFEMVMILARVGEEFVNQARLIGSYTDRTGNLRSSIGYVVLNNGDVKNKGGGETKGNEFIAWAKGEFANEDLVLVGFAGMEYAAAVESKGFDVITNAIPLAEAMKKALENA